MPDIAVAHALLDIGAVGFTPDKPITFKSGILSPVYVDNRRLPYHPQQWHTIIDAFVRRIRDEHLAFDIIAGVAVGGVPHSAALAYTLRCPSVFVRKESKGYGKNQRVEGGSVTSQRVLMIEDLITTGSSALTAIEALRAEGAIVQDLCAIVSYGFSEATQALVGADITLHTLIDFPTILEVARQRGQLTSEQETTIKAWLANPHAWGI